MKIYLLDWGNGMIGTFRADNLKQIDNCSKECLEWTLKHVMNLYKVDSLEVSFIESHEELNKLRENNGFEKKPIF